MISCGDLAVNNVKIYLKVMADTSRNKIKDLYKKRRELQDTVEDYNLEILTKLAEMRAIDYQIRMLEEKNSPASEEKVPYYGNVVPLLSE